MDLFDLFAKLSLNTDDFEEGVADSEKKAGSFASKLKSGLKTAGKVGAAAIGAITTAAGVMTKTIVDGTKEVAAYGDTIDKESQKIGISAEAYQEWDAVLQHSGTSIDSLKKGMTTLSKAVESDSEAFAKLGVSTDELKNLSQEEIFEKVIAGLQDMEEGTERAVIAQQLLGGAAKELGPLMNTSAEDTQAMRDRVRELGGVMSNDAVKAAAAYQDSLQDMQTALDGAKRGMISEFMPAVTSVMDGLTEVFAGNGEGGIAKISEGVSQFVDKLSETMPRVLEFGSQILLSLSDAIIDNLPMLIDAATKTVLTLATGLVENLPKIIKVGLDVLIALAKGIVENLSTLIPTIVDVVLEIVDILTEPKTLSLLVDASIAIIIALATGLIDALPKLLEKAPEIVTNLVTAIVDNAPKLFNAAWELIKKLASSLVQVMHTIWEIGPQIVEAIWNGIKSMFNSVVGWGGRIIETIKTGINNAWNNITNIGKNLVEGIWKGISGAADWLWQKVKGWASGLFDNIKKFFGIASPSKKFAELGKFTVQGFGKGFDDNFGGVARDIHDKFASLEDESVNIGANLTGLNAGEIFGGSTAQSESLSLNTALAKINATLDLILENMGFDIVLDDGVIAGRIDKRLGQTAMWKMRGNA